MRAAAQYGGAPAWVEPIYEQSLDLVYRLQFGLLLPDDIEPPWDDLLIAAKVGMESKQASARGSKSGAVATPIASQNERAKAIKAAQEEMRRRQGGG